MDMKEALNRIASNLDLSREEMKDVMHIVMNGEATDAQIGAFLMGLAVRGETSNELYAGAKAMRQHARTVKVDGPLLDTCGTGGLPWKSLNTSTASALVIALQRVTKHFLVGGNLVDE